MKTINKIKILSLLMFSMLFLQCSKDDNLEPLNEPTVMELLTSGKWYYELWTNHELTACEKTGYFQFLKDGTMVTTYVDGSSNDCKLNSVTYPYKLITNNTEISIEDTFPRTYKIVHISKTLLVLKVDAATIYIYDTTPK